MKKAILLLLVIARCSHLLAMEPRVLPNFFETQEQAKEAIERRDVTTLQRLINKGFNVNAPFWHSNVNPLDVVWIDAEWDYRHNNKRISSQIKEVYKTLKNAGAKNYSITRYDWAPWRGTPEDKEEYDDMMRQLNN